MAIRGELLLSYRLGAVKVREFGNVCGDLALRKIGWAGGGRGLAAGKAAVSKNERPSRNERELWLIGGMCHSPG